MSAHTIELVSLKSTELSPGFTIQRALPHKQVRRVGAWAFLDHIGPVDLRPDLGMKVRSHPHIGLQTFTWMISGEIEHKDSVGAHQIIKAGEVNLMTSGNGIAHTETSVGDSGRIHAAQLWIALPNEAKTVAAEFEHYPELPQIETAAATQTVLVGEWHNQTAPVKVYTPLVAVDVQVKGQQAEAWKLNPEFEYGVLPMIGSIELNGQTVKSGEFAYIGTGNTELHWQAEAGSRVLLIGGEPLQEELIVWWNFIARSQEEIEQARRDWQAQLPRFGDLATLGEWLDAPEITGQLKASGAKQA